jgi:predicted MFS family arabinose efflux permease
VSIGVGSFALSVTELLPVGLLTPIAKEFAVSEGTAGLMVGVPAVVAAVSALAFVVIAGKIDRRLLLIAGSALLLLSDLLALIAPDFTVMMIARGLLGVALGGFWAIAGSLGVRLVGKKFIGAATSVIFAGMSVAAVIAVPLGSFISTFAGWREAFLAATILGAVVVLAQIFVVPKLIVDEAPSLRALPTLLRRPAVIIVLITVTLVYVGHYVSYTYITPYLGADLGFDGATASALLLAFGLGGIVGNFVGGALAAQWLKPVLITLLALMVGSVIASQFLTDSFPTTLVVMVLWGLGFGAGPASFQVWIFTAAHGHPEAGTALLVSTLNVAIAVGTSVGGGIVDTVGVPAAFWFGGALLAAALLTVAILGSRRNDEKAALPARSEFAASV